MKKIGIVATAALLSVLVLSNHSGLAISKSPSNNSLAEEEPVQLEDATNFIKFSGVIIDIEKDTKTTRFIAENTENSLIMIFPVNNEVLLVDNEKGEKLNRTNIEKGSNADFYYSKNKPMPLIYPATITPEIMIVNGKEFGQVKVAKFDTDFVSLDNELKLHISKDTIIINEKGDSITAADLADKELIVFYKISTRSIPAQTTPTKIIALEDTDESLKEIQQIIDEDHYFKNDTKMIPVRKVAEQLDYSVEWNGKQNTILIRKQARSFLLSIGKKEYGYNRSLRYFEVAPELKNGKSYVSEELLELLLEK